MQLLDEIVGLVNAGWAWLQAELLNVNSLAQLVAIIVVFFLARMLATPIQGWLADISAAPMWVRRLASIASRLTQPALWLLFQAVGMAVVTAIGSDDYIFRISISLLTAWLVIHLVVAPIRNQMFARLIAFIVWIVAALNILGLLGSTIKALDETGISLGENQNVSVLEIIQGVVVLILLVWLAGFLAKLIENQVRQQSTITPSVRVLITKISRIVLIIFAALIGLSSAGLDLTVFAVVGGAIGLGIGFGLQKVVSNLFSGFILLLDRSIKPGDVVEVQGTYGWINHLAARYTSVITRDGTEFLIPNEDMVTQPVINWSHSNRLVRQRIQVGIAYDSDLYLARELAVQAASETERVLENPAPVCHLVDFADSALLLELRFWIEDPQGGIVNVSSEVRLRIYDLFKENNIAIPFPQRDLHIVSAPASLPPAGESG